VEFWKKLNRASAVTIAVSAVGAGVAVVLEKAGGATFSALAAAAWLTLGLVSAAGLGALTLIGDRVLTAKQIERYRGALILANLVWVSGLVATTGGLDRPFWILFAGPLLIAAVSLPQLHSLAVGVLASVGVVIAFAVTGDLVKENLGALVLVLPSGPAITWFVGMLCAFVWEERRAAQRERDELSERVDALSGVLAQAAEGDLAVRVRTDGDNGSVAALTESFSNTLTNLRLLVEQIRSGGEQITASAGDLLATAEEHAASATQQSSAVAETTSTIEELAATAAQIADTAESVARYAAETLRHAEDGRTAVATSVTAMDAIADRVNSIATRALSLGEKGHEIGRILEVIDDLADQTNLLALNAAIEAARAASTAVASPSSRRRCASSRSGRRSPPARSRPSSPRSRPRPTPPSWPASRVPRRSRAGPRSPATWSTPSSGSPAWSTRRRRRRRRSPSPPSSSGPPRTRSSRR
jgi:hypothetical protein